MTNQEAIDILKCDISADKQGIEYCHDEVGIEALEMAIKALEQEPKILNTLDFAIDASNGDTNYFVGFRNGLRYAKSLIDGEEEPRFENCTEKVIRMRDATPEEQKLINNYIKSISKPTGVNFGTLEQEPMTTMIYPQVEGITPTVVLDCDRNICIKNEYNGIGCEECEVTKSQEPKIGQMSICKRCIHSNVCGEEGKFDKALTYCDDFLGWIPVSERLPEKSGNYWCTFYWHAFKEEGIYCTGVDSYTTKEDAEENFEDPEEYVGWNSQDVIAWMPLPKPYESQ